MNTLTIYSATWCAPCTLLKNALIENGIEYTVIDIQSEEYKQSGMALRSVPTAVIKDPEGNVLLTLNGPNLLEAIKDAI